MKYELKKIEIEGKEKDQEYRLNELKIRELRRQIPHKTVKPIDKQSVRSESRGSNGPKRAVKRSSLGPKKATTPATTPGKTPKIAKEPTPATPPEEVVEEAPTEEKSPEKVAEVPLEEPTEDDAKEVDEVNVGTPMVGKREPPVEKENTPLAIEDDYDDDFDS